MPSYGFLWGATTDFRRKKETHLSSFRLGSIDQGLVLDMAVSLLELRAGHNVPPISTS